MTPPVYRLILEYDGTDFSGWQIQPGRRTVQAELEAAVQRLFGRRLPTVGASRTDSGVHAAGQVASFRAPRAFPGDLRAALNRYLPEDVSVSKAHKADASFHARRSAVSKTYRYSIHNHPVRSALRSRTSAWIPAPLNLAKMRREADRLRRRTDFTAFGGPSSRRRSPTCRLRRLRVHRHGSEIRIEVTGDRFLHNMVRRLAGRLVQAGRGDRDRPWTLPAKGLTLLRVNYES